ncbi:MAG TPA: hypothetical protein VI874_02135, partial [Candidatus Norongarragalinales archaeon]|nr:hypothetical protein [Candidatus Norongarragalinales archaeon]
VEYADAFFERTDTLLSRTDFSQKKNDELAKIYEELYDLQRRSHASGLVWFSMEVEDQLLTKTLLDRLSLAVKKTNHPKRANEIFSLLTTPTLDSFAQKEEKSLLEIASKIKDVRVRKLFESDDLGVIEGHFSKMDPALSRELDEHVRRFCWLPFMYEGPAWDKKYFIQVLKGLLHQNVTALLSDVRLRHETAKKEQEKIIRELNLDASTITLLEVARGMVFTKGYRKDCLYHFFWRLDPFLKEVAKRLQLTLRQVRRFMPWEIPSALRQGRFDADELNRRYSCYAFYVEGNSQKVLSGKNAEAFLDSFDLETQKSVADLSELTGECACPGFAKGLV